MKYNQIFKNSLNRFIFPNRERRNRLIGFRFCIRYSIWIMPYYYLLGCVYVCGFFSFIEIDF